MRKLRRAIAEKIRWFIEAARADLADLKTWLRRRLRKENEQAVKVSGQDHAGRN